MNAVAGIGAPVRRREDLRLLTGNGHYSDDLTLPGQLRAVMLRSPHAHADIVGIDTTTAKLVPGVVAVFTADDLLADGVQPIPPDYVFMGAAANSREFPDPVLLRPSSKPEAQALTELTPAEMHTMLAKAGTQHHIDADLLASVVKAESGGRVMAVSRTGAQGLMQLMPDTANEMGVSDAFRPEQNIAGGTAYLDQLLVRYHDNAALALAAYNAGPGAVDKYHGIPPYRETRAYVARVIREFNRRKTAAAVTKTQMAGLR